MTDWAYPALAVVAVGVGLYFLVRGATCDGAGRATCWAHALMAAGMAAMFSPWQGLIPAPAGAVVFTVVAAWFAAERLRGGGTGAADEATHVAVGSAAMVVMYLGMPEHPSTAEGPAGHADHLSAASTGLSSLLTVVVGLILTGYFAWHAWEITSGRRRARTAEAESAGGTAVLTGVRTETAAHVVLDVLMAVMFLSML